jgi:hypothetical protein
MAGDRELADGADAQLSPGESHHSRQRLARPLVAAGRCLEQRQGPLGTCDSPDNELAPVVLAAGQRAELLGRGASVCGALRRGDYLPLGGQRQALGYLAVRLFATGFGLALVFFAVFCALTGVLILRSRLMPRVIGAMIVAGVCYFVADLFHRA